MPIKISQIRALCFDVDGTLSDTDDLWVSKFEKILRPFSFILPGRDTRGFARWVVMGIETPGNLVYHWLDRLHLDDEMARVFNFMAQHGPQRRKQKHYWIIPGVSEAISQLRERYPLAAVSARDERTTLAFLDQFDLRITFTTIVTAQTCTYTKPYPDPVHWAAREMGVEAKECLMIGDTTVDIRAGKAAGAQTVGVLCGFGEEKELHRAGADLILPSTAMLPEILLSGESK